MNDSIKQLLGIQSRDLELDRLAADVTTIPTKINAIKADIQRLKLELETAKKDLIRFQLAKKQKDLDLDVQEQAIRKHSNELNSVKTNEAYRALTGEIDKAKKEKSELEDQILQIMEQTDQAQKIWKESEGSSKADESGLNGQIHEWESKQKAAEDQIAAKKVEREEAAATLPKPLFDHYEKLRKGVRGGNAVVVIKNEQCGGCHMKVSQNLINELRRGQKLITCESCSRIVYLDEAEEKANADAAKLAKAEKAAAPVAPAEPAEPKSEPVL